MGRAIIFMRAFNKHLVSTCCHPHPRDTKVKKNLSLAFKRLLSPVGNIENCHLKQNAVRMHDKRGNISAYGVRENVLWSRWHSAWSLGEV